MSHTIINIYIYFTGFYRQSQFSDIFQPLLNADKIKMDIARNSEDLADRKADKQRELYIQQKAKQHVLTERAQ